MWIYAAREGFVIVSKDAAEPLPRTLGAGGRGPSQTLIQFHVVGVEDGVCIDALEIGPPFKEQIEEVPAAGLQDNVERSIPLEVEPVAAAQQQGRERMLAALKGDLQRRLRSCALADGSRGKLKWLPVSDPSLDIVESSFATQLVESADVVGRLGERAMALTG